MTQQKPIFTSDQLAILNDVFLVELNFDTPVISAVFKPKMDNYTDEKWDMAMEIMHPVLPLQEDVINGEYVYKPFYQDENAFNKSASVYVAIKEYQHDLTHPKAPSDLYYYGSASNKAEHMKHLNKFFNVVRFSKEATGPFWYALEVAIPETEDRGYDLLSHYITPRRMKIDKPMWVEGNISHYQVGPIVCYDLGTKKEYRFFSKIVADLEAYQKKQSEYHTGTWEPRRILAYTGKMKQHSR